MVNESQMSQGAIPPAPAMLPGRNPPAGPRKTPAGREEEEEEEEKEEEEKEETGVSSLWQ